MISNLRKYYNSHVWVTAPDPYGISYLGISDFAIHHFLRFRKLNYSLYPKTIYGIKNRVYIPHFLHEYRNLQAIANEKGQKIPVNKRMQYERFAYKKNEAFCIMETVEFDVELQSPCQMCVLEEQDICRFDWKLLCSDYFFRVLVLDPKELETLMDQQAYAESYKIIDYI